VRAIADTHALVWWLTRDPRLSSTAQKFISSSSNDVLVSAATAWELSIKNRSGKLNVQELLDNFEDAMDQQGFSLLPISIDHALRAGSLPLHHSDPFDRMLVAQAQAQHVALITADKAFDAYGVRRIW
jgi:PIN domain nuclease of toxin-antitoxin system